ncbi:histone acetyltransferase KAT7 isoform X2 [Neocloeon triangulifer]|uniref:histone acetyltransferase KAT7 isoform X2 n=1 Tax=Neocloeon triangulifer TaxID=2078957 RepID=UPI00286FAC91|nr:histone acetyltransferase KAT7 isoform X2 [Neocloeon triangulifer]
MSRKKARSSSESGSSSNSSGSSSSSSSSSGSDSSSSDSDGSSAPSQRSLRSVKNRGHSTDSEPQPPPKKTATPAAKNAGKNAPAKSAPDSDKKGQKKANSKPAYTSDSDESVEVKPNTNSSSKQRKVPAKPKATATVTPLLRKAAAPASKSTPKGKANANKIPFKAQPKTKSIFSPEHSSESDTPEVSVKASTSKSTPAQNKNGAIKKQPPIKAASSASKSKEPAPPPPRRNTRYSTSSTTGSSGSSDSSSDSESSTLAVATPQKRPPKKPTPQSKSPSKNNASRPPASGSDTETSPTKQPVTRKLTRSSNVRRNSKPSKAAAVPTGKKAPARSVTKKGKGRPASSAEISTVVVPIEERKCPVRNCDSSGHLSGRHDKHFTVEACPIFHNLKPHQCYDMYLERKKHDDERRRALTCLGRKSPGRTQSMDQKAYQQKVKDSRDKASALSSTVDSSNSLNESLVDFNREPKLGNVASEYDLRLFMEAQAAASDKMEDDLKGLPSNKGTKYIEMGKFDMEVWYQSPYPEEYASLPKLYLCEFCLRYMKTRIVLKRHLTKCVWRHPPGEEVYRKEKISVWEVDGKKYKVFCQNLCLLAKFFLDHKTLYNEVEPFLFYVMTTADAEGCHTVGYFSKEKNSFLNYNVSCILTLPPYQRQGFGRLLIDFSYQLTRKEGKIGSPEKPLSDLGLISYRSYWKDVLLEYLCNFGGKELSIKDISQEMAINSYDIVSTLQALGMMKYWKGKHIILKKQDVIEEYVERTKRRGKVKEIDPSCLNWTPPVNPQSRGPP